MKSSRAWLLGLTLGMAGLFAGRMIGPSAVRFPSSDEGRSAEQMERELSAALIEPRAFPRAGTVTRLLEGLSPGNVSGAVRAVSALAGRTDPVDLQLFLSAWVLLDPVAAIDEVRKWPIQARREIALMTIIREWAASGRQLEAANYYDAITDPDTRRVMAGPLVRGWALSGDEDALPLARRLWETEERLDVVDGLVRGLLHVQGPRGVFDVASRVDPRNASPFDQRLVRVSLNLAGREDPLGAARFYEALSREQDIDWLEGTLVRIAGVYRNEDPRGALEWLLTLRESAEQRRALTETMGTWAIREFDAAWAWFEEREIAAAAGEPLSAIDSALVTGLVRRMARTEPEQASTWALRIRSGQDRVEMIRRVAYFWSMADSEAAVAWVAGLELEPDVRDRIEQAVEWGRSGRSDADSPDEPTVLRNESSSD